MKSPLSLTAAASVVVLALTACDASPEESQAPVGGGSVAEMEPASAPDPQGAQASHEELREALGRYADGDITDTDDHWEHLREISTELQKLSVRPTDCKAYVTASAQPVPSGALTAAGEQEGRQTLIYSFEDGEAAEQHLQAEQQGVDGCSDYTVVRDLGEEQVETETRLREVQVLSAADAALAMRRAVESDDGTQRDVAVLLRHSAHVVAVVQPTEDSPDEDTAEETVVELEAQAAAVLSELTGEELEAPEPEPEGDDEDEDEESD